MRFCFGHTAFAAFIGVKAKLLWVRLPTTRQALTKLTNNK
jgi:hypothetical protein